MNSTFRMIGTTWDLKGLEALLGPFPVWRPCGGSAELLALERPVMHARLCRAFFPHDTILAHMPRQIVRDRGGAARRLVALATLPKELALETFPCNQEKRG